MEFSPVQPFSCPTKPRWLNQKSITSQINPKKFDSFLVESSKTTEDTSVILSNEWGIYLVSGEKCFKAIDIVIIEILLILRSVFKFVHKMTGNVQGVFKGSDDFGPVAVFTVSFVHAIGEAFQFFQLTIEDSSSSFPIIIFIQPVWYLQCYYNPINFRFIWTPVGILTVEKASIFKLTQSIKIGDMQQ